MLKQLTDPTSAIAPDMASRIDSKDKAMDAEVAHESDPRMQRVLKFVQKWKSEGRSDAL